MPVHLVLCHINSVFLFQLPNVLIWNLYDGKSIWGGDTLIAYIRREIKGDLQIICKLQFTFTITAINPSNCMKIIMYK